MRALVVDDSAAMRRLLVEVVRERGYEVAAVGTGEEALAAHVRAPFDLLLLDWTLPGLSGVELCRALRLLPSGHRPTILVITGRSRPSDIHTVLDAGADDFVPKPIDADQLRTRLIVASRQVTRATPDEGPDTSLHALTEAAADAILVLRADRVDEANPSAARMLGYEAPGALLGTPLDALVHADDRALLRERTTPCIVRFRQRDGGFRSLEATASLDPQSGRTLVVARPRTSDERGTRTVVDDRVAATVFLLSGLAAELGEPLRRAIASVENDAEALTDLGRLEEILAGITALADDDRAHHRTDPASALHAALRLGRVTLRRRARVEVDVEPLPRVALSPARFSQIVLGLMGALAAILEDTAPGNLRVHARTDDGWCVITFRLRAGRTSPRLVAALDPTNESELGLVVARALALHTGGELVIEGTPDEELVLTVRLPPSAHAQDP